MADITINISNSLHAKSFDAQERIHSNAFERVTNLISNQLDVIGRFNRDYLQSNSEADFERYYNTISVLGERGVGKTSFLMSLRREYQQVQERDVYLLPLIDPTLFEEKGHLFLLIVTLIDDEVHSLEEGDLDDDQKAALDRYEERKQLLAQGLPTLDNEGMTYTEPQWHEDGYMMIRGMESVKAAFNLERNFHKLVNEALKVLKAKSFLLMFDDIDVDFKKGWMVLETLRKFLTTPQLIIILSGNIKLYSKNIRKQQWRNFGKELLMNEMEINSKGIDEYTRLVNEIEGQYMQKVLKSENRVFLYTIYDNILINNDAYKVRYSDQDDEVSLSNAYKAILEMNGVKGASEINQFTSFLMRTSMRTQVHFLFNMKNRADNDLMSKISVFSSRMYAQNVDIDLIVNSLQYNMFLLHFLINKQLLEEAYQLIPNTDSTDINSSLTGFSFVFTHLLKKDPSIIFDYWCRVCLARNNMHYLSYNSDNKDYVGKYCIGAGLFQSRDLRSLIGNSMVFLSSLRRNANKFEGTIPLMGFGDSAKTSARNLNKRIDRILSNTDDLRRLLGYMPLVTLLYDGRNGRSLYYSVYSLLANIGQIIKAEDICMMKQSIRTACLPVNYQVKSDETNVLQDSQDVITEYDINIDDQIVEKLALFVSKWKNNFINNPLDYGNYLFGRVST